jgi:hypothetical protein
MAAFFAFIAKAVRTIVFGVGITFTVLLIIGIIGQLLGVEAQTQP